MTSHGPTKCFAHTNKVVNVNKQSIADEQATFKDIFLIRHPVGILFTKLSFEVAECRISRTLCQAIYLLISCKMCVFLPTPKRCS